jgi:hypothetical protein
MERFANNLKEKLNGDIQGIESSETGYFQQIGRYGKILMGN